MSQCEHVVMDIFGVIRGVIEVVESSEYDPEEAAALERAIRLSLTPPERPSFRPLYDRPSSPVRPPPPTMPKPQPPAPPVVQPKPMYLNPRILVFPGVYGPIPEHISTATIEDVTDSPLDSRGPTESPDQPEDEPPCTGEVVLDRVGSFHENRSDDPTYGSSSRRP